MPSAVVAAWLTDQALAMPPAAAADWSVYTRAAPDGPGVPARIVVVYDTAPVRNGRDMRTGRPLFRWGVQIVLRGNAEDAAIIDERAAMICSAADLAYRVVVGASTIVHFSRTSGPIPLEPEDERRRSFVSVNYLVSLEG